MWGSLWINKGVVVGFMRADPYLITSDAYSTLEP